MLEQHTAMRLPRGLSIPTTWLGALGLSCLSLACTRTPDERVAAIARLLDEARSYRAEEYLPEDFVRAEGLLSAARSELAAQQEKPWFLSSRRRSRELIEESEVAASLVRAEAAVAVVRARHNAARHVSGAHAALDLASEAYWRAPRGADTRADVLRMRSDLDALRGDLTEAELALEQGEFLFASQRAAEVEERAHTVASIIDRASAFRATPSIGASAPSASSDAKNPAEARATPTPGALDLPFRAPASPLHVANTRSEVAVHPDRRAG